MNRLFILAIIATMLIPMGCKRRLGPTNIEVEDSIRHYYPVRQGQQLNIVYKIGNKGPEPLKITDIQPSCGCIILAQDAERVIGNIAPHGLAILRFDVNVVPDADYTRDYEQLYKEYNLKNGIVDDIVGGKERDKGYYVDSAFQSRRTRDKEKYRLDF